MGMGCCGRSTYLAGMNLVPGEMSRETWKQVLTRAWCLSLCLLMLSTWQLWLPAREVPRVPAFGWLTALPPALDYLLLSVLLFGLMNALVRPDRARGPAITIVALVGLMLLDQFRWQPWAYQLFLIGVALAAAPAAAARSWLQWLLISVYLFSGFAKLNLTFANTLGQQILSTFVGFLGLELSPVVSDQRIAMALSFPIMEFVAAAMMIVPRSRAIGVSLACVIHVGNLLVLGPWGLDHSLGVLLWNVVSLAVLILLFYPTSPEEPSELVPPGAWPAKMAKGLILFAIVLPVGYTPGLWDRWPSWGLYAPSGERAEIFVHQRVADRLPSTLPTELAGEDSAWQRVRVDTWLIKQTNAPRYPQNRVAIALALALDNQARLGDYLRVELASAADRFSGERDRKLLSGSQEIREYARRYWLNTVPVSSK